MRIFLIGLPIFNVTNDNIWHVKVNLSLIKVDRALEGGVDDDCALKGVRLSNLYLRTMQGKFWITKGSELKYTQVTKGGGCK